MTEKQSRTGGVGAIERLLTTGAVAIIGGAILWDSAAYQGGSRFFPVAIGGGLLVLSGVSALAHRRERHPTDEANLPIMAFGMALLAAFIFLASRGGFLSCTLLFIPAMALLGGYRNIPVLVIATLSFVALAYVVFVIGLGVSLPADILWG